MQALGWMIAALCLVLLPGLLFAALFLAVLSARSRDRQGRGMHGDCRPHTVRRRMVPPVFPGRGDRRASRRADAGGPGRRGRGIVAPR